MHIFTVKLTAKCVITVYIQLNTIKTRNSYFENFEAKTGQNLVIANLPPKSSPQKIIGLQLI